MIGLALTNFLWPHHTTLFLSYLDTLQSISATRILEIAPGHGLLGYSAINNLVNDYCYSCIDISESSLSLTSQLFVGVDNYSSVLADVTTYNDHTGTYDLIICGELLEHVENPSLILKSIKNLLTVNGIAYVTAAITAAAPDHIYLFRSPDNVISMIESVGLQIIKRTLGTSKAVYGNDNLAPRVLSCWIHA